MMMPEYNIAVAYSALKSPCLDSEQNQNKIIQPKKFPRKHCQTTISNKLSGEHGHRLKCSTFRPSADSKLEPATNVFSSSRKMLPLIITLREGFLYQKDDFPTNQPERSAFSSVCLRILQVFTMVLIYPNRNLH